ncbi:SDR family oxidoreductase [Salinibacterium sp. dk2585]|uniref:NAD(P)-dependent oxidoreductase n=1 Tax=unclassified Salinibacterium TaxID=2632331 RepID=UPI0011C2469D|nr:MULTISPECIES: NAD(P)-binding oxidoreductase [unclassified Salinibacterium]QEE61028.1 SDR family oxidoreductase [Salinibacterium sp. dk2585]TXK52970.1 SDR family oxidoreductase [Salinibacterium sp. dk5596]
MKIIVFGASGGVGQRVVERAAAAGHEVTAFVRNPEKLGPHEGVTVVQGDAFDAEAVASAIEGHDAVVSCLSSSTALKKSDELARMTRNIVEGMQRGGVNRIVYCASAGVDGELPGAIGKTVMWMLRYPLADHAAALGLIAAAGLDATIARPMSLTNDPYADYVETMDGAPEGSKPIPRASVADFMVKALEEPQAYSGTSVGLGLP